MSVHHCKYLSLTTIGKHIMVCLSYGLKCEYRKDCIGYSLEKNSNKMEIVLLTHLQRVTVLPSGSYDDDDILTEAPQRYSQLYHFLGLGQEISSLGFHLGKFSTGLMTPAGLLDENGWGHLAVSTLRRPIWLCQGSAREWEYSRVCGLNRVM